MLRTIALTDESQFEEKFNDLINRIEIYIAGLGDTDVRYVTAGTRIKIRTTLEQVRCNSGTCRDDPIVPTRLATAISSTQASDDTENSISIDHPKHHESVMSGYSATIEAMSGLPQNCRHSSEIDDNGGSGGQSADDHGGDSSGGGFRDDGVGSYSAGVGQVLDFGAEGLGPASSTWPCRHAGGGGNVNASLVATDTVGQGSVSAAGAGKLPVRKVLVQSF